MRLRDNYFKQRKFECVETWKAHTEGEECTEGREVN